METNRQMMMADLDSLSLDQLTALLEMAASKKRAPAGTATKAGKEGSSGNVGLAGSVGMTGNAGNAGNAEKAGNADKTEPAEKAGKDENAEKTEKAENAEKAGKTAADTEAMDWGDTLENDGSDYLVLKEGDYSFVITGFEHARFGGSEKLPACPKAALTLRVTAPEGTVSVKTDLLLVRCMEWKLAAFFRCIGRKERGARLRMDWSNLVGCRGRAHFRPRTYTGSDGKTHETNDCVRFLDYNSSFFSEGNAEARDEAAYAATVPDLIPLPDDTDLPF